ncbi:nodulation protein NodH [Falsigemmobacter intermedius]|uniref:Nodulation protein NodH n=1 Tax=Falsigemmobacter intermedius TaxID=1553448 RepID=A0A444MDF7_9RHOB|nr:nodulation protein NodH [Falsigemmobacter intermedius]RWY42416.1 nodulation protein NodH [Falsigemmobacter intermedius]
MSRPFDRFILLADMRTGSNFLEANLNALPGVTCHGEAFNPVFIARKDHESYLGITLEARTRDPHALLRAMEAATEGLAGFRFFHDHDPRILDTALADPRCAKIVLTRNPLESYVSLQIARATGQWKLGDARRRREARARFDGAEFEDHVTRLQAFQLQIHRALQTSGQTAFWIDYEDIGELSVIQGLAAFLGVPAPEALDDSVKKQNPESLDSLIENPEDLSEGLARLDRFNLSRTPNFEPRRGPQVPSFMAARDLPLLFMPIRSGPVDEVRHWLSEIGGGLIEGFDRRSLRAWIKEQQAPRSFTVLRHPLLRAVTAFEKRILRGPRSETRQILRKNWKLLLPDDPAEATAEELSAAFATFLRFLKGNLAGQTPLKIDPAWASQAAVIEGFSGFLPPGHLWREEDLGEALPLMAKLCGKAAPPPPLALPQLPCWLQQAHEAAVRDAYARDYAAFGFGDLIR